MVCACLVVRPFFLYSLLVENKRRLAERIVATLRQAGYPAVFAGGCVRDMIRGVEPHDYDIATSARPDQVQKLFSKTVTVGAQFGVVLVIEDHQKFEVATFRAEGEYRDGRRPSSVEFSDAETDARRRDFTINGMFFDPVENRVLDFVGGQADLEKQIIRTIGPPPQRFSEDKLRLLRCVRFASVLGFQIEPVTAAALKSMASQIGLVSAERIRDELIKIFTGPNAGRGLTLLDESGLLTQLLPEVAAMKGVAQPPQFHPEGDVFIHTRLILDNLKNPSATLIFAALLHDVGKPPTMQVVKKADGTETIHFYEHDRVGTEIAEKILRRLRFPNDQRESILACVSNHMRFKDVTRMRKATLKRLLARPTFAEELELHRADCTCSHRKLDNFEFLRRALREFSAEQVKPKPLVNGHDLLRLGYSQGPRVGRILQQIEELQLGEKISTRDQALNYAKKHRPKIPAAKKTQR